ncbi:MAG: ATP-binding protein, partial [Betaproteobacteria bacterium]
VLAGISHDLRTPLARLRLESEMSIHNNDARDAVIEDIEQMDTIIGQFLNYARSESAEGAELSDINALLNLLASAQGRSSTPPHLVLGALPITMIQPKAFSRALVNLLENARKYGGNEITVETRSENGEIMIDVLDRGPGIPESEIERMKRPFTRLENARTNATGTGLGLAIVERIARLHGGRLELLAREGGGLIARLCLPVRV